MAEFTIEPNMFRGLQGEIDAAVGAVGDKAGVWGEATASEGMEKLAAALEDGKLEALSVVGWEINERCVHRRCVCFIDAYYVYMALVGNPNTEESPAPGWRTSARRWTASS